MPSPEELSLSKANNLSRSSSKRKVQDSQQKQGTSTQKSSNPDIGSGIVPTQSTLPFTKRLKTSHSGSLDMTATQSSVARGKLVDLTRPSPTYLPSRPAQFLPNTGARKLLIKNQKTKPHRDIEEYYNKAWTELNNTITAVFRREAPTVPFEVLCRGVEATCRRGEAKRLSIHLRDRCKTYLEKTLLPKIESEAGSTNVQALSAVHKYWTQWNGQATLLRSLFSYLDRSYLLNQRELLQLEDMGIQQFRYVVFKSKGKVLGAKVITGMCDLIQFDRAKDTEQFNSALLKESVAMLHIFGIYSKSFEGEFLARSQEYFDRFAQDQSSSTMKNYISTCDRLLYREETRCDAFNFNTSTKRTLLEYAHKTLVEQQKAILLNPSGLAGLLDNTLMSSLRTLYKLLRLSAIQREMKDPFELYIKEVGAAIVRDPEKVNEMVVGLLELKRSLDLVIRDAFDKDESFTWSLREAFGSFINDSKNTTAWGTGNSKVGEMIAKYMDTLLRGGLKAVPPSLASDAKDRDAAEKQGQSSTGDEDAELDRQLEQALELFRFIEGKDVFEAFYKKDLARRLLMNRSASQDAERTMLAKLKTECGFSFTHNLEQMFKDQELAHEEMSSFKNNPEIEKPNNIDLNVNVLSAAAWPTYPDVQVTIPQDVTDIIMKYDAHYKHKHVGRKLTWKHALGHCVLKSTFKKGFRELLVSSFQAVVLYCFNSSGDGSLSYQQIQAATGLVDVELQRTLQSLACTKLHILNKKPKGRDVNTTDHFTFNEIFWDPKFRIKINQIQLKETKEENKETHERVHQDRQYETQAAIVRIMKSRKTMAHANLVGEVIEQTKKRGAVELGEIKKNIEKLIEKEYIDREEGGMYTYMA